MQWTGTAVDELFFFLLHFVKRLWYFPCLTWAIAKLWMEWWGKWDAGNPKPEVLNCEQVGKHIYLGSESERSSFFGWSMRLERELGSLDRGTEFWHEARQIAVSKETIKVQLMKISAGSQVNRSWKSWEATWEPVPLSVIRWSQDRNSNGWDSSRS